MQLPLEETKGTEGIEEGEIDEVINKILVVLRAMMAYKEQSLDFLLKMDLDVDLEDI